MSSALSAIDLHLPLISEGKNIHPVGFLRPRRRFLLPVIVDLGGSQEISVKGKSESRLGANNRILIALIIPPFSPSLRFLTLAQRLLFRRCKHSVKTSLRGATATWQSMQKKTRLLHFVRNDTGFTECLPAGYCVILAQLLWTPWVTMPQGAIQSALSLILSNRLLEICDIYSSNLSNYITALEDCKEIRLTFQTSECIIWSNREQIGVLQSEFHRWP